MLGPFFIEGLKNITKYLELQYDLFPVSDTKYMNQKNPSILVDSLFCRQDDTPSHYSAKVNYLDRDSSTLVVEGTWSELFVILFLIFKSFWKDGIILKNYEKVFSTKSPQLVLEYCIMLCNNLLLIVEMLKFETLKNCSQ